MTNVGGVAAVLRSLMKVASCAEHLLHCCCPSIDTLVHIGGTMSVQGRALLMERGEGRGARCTHVHLGVSTEQPQVCVLTVLVPL